MNSFINFNNGSEPLFCTRNIILAMVALSTVILPIDFYAITIALPVIGNDLKSNPEDLNWVGNVFMIAYASMLMIGGAVADRYGRKRIFNAGAIIFFCSSLACSLVKATEILNFFRALQGAGAALMFSAGISLIMRQFSSEDRSYAFGLFGIISGIAAVAGPLIGSLLVHSIGWRNLFLVNAVFGVMLLIFFMRIVQEVIEPRLQRLDMFGFVTYAFSLSGLLYTIVAGNDHGWKNMPIPGIFVISILLFVVFVLNEKKSADPVLDIRLFSIRGFAGTALASLVFGMTFWCLFLYVFRYFQDALAYTTVQTGLALLPFAIPLFLMGPIIRWLNKITDPRNHIILGLGLITGGTFSMTFIPFGYGWLYFFPGAIIAATGSKLINSYLINISISMVPEEHSGMAAGITATIRQLGLALSITIVGTISGYYTANLKTEQPVAKMSSRLSARPTRSKSAFTLDGLSKSMGSKPSRTLLSQYKTFVTLLEYIATVGFTGTLLVLVLIPEGLLVQEEERQNFCGITRMKKLKFNSTRSSP